MLGNKAFFAGVFLLLLYSCLAVFLLEGGLFTFFPVGRELPEEEGERAWPDFGPRLAIIIDDIAFPCWQLKEIFKLGYPLTLSFLPQAGLSPQLSQESYQRGFEVLLHLPMQSVYPSKNRGYPLLIRRGMKQKEIPCLLGEAVSLVPWAVGVNNHMGSLATADYAVMESLLRGAEKEGLFFVDSFTSPASVVLEVASDLGMPAVKNSFFLDNRDELSYIKGQILALAEEVRRQGEAIGIGHIDRRFLVPALKEVLPQILEKGVQIVPVSSLVYQPARLGQRL